MAWTSPRTWAVNDVVTASLLNVHLRDNFKAIGDAWGSYTPSWTGSTTNPVLGNGTIAGAYAQAGKLVFYKVTLTTGSTSTYGSGAWLFSLPVTASSFSVTAAGSTGFATLYDSSGTTRYFRMAYQNSTTTVAMADMSATLVTATVPFTWATGDSLSIQGFYEAA